MASLRKRVSLVWFKNTDLRLHDHLPLLAAHKSSEQVIHLFCADNLWFRTKTRQLNISKNGHFRCQFIKEALLDLRTSLRELNSELIIRFGSSAQIIPSIVSQYHIDRVYYHDEIHSDEQSVVDDVIAACNRKNQRNKVQFVSFFGGNTLYDPEDLPWRVNQWRNFPPSFTRFRTAVERKIAVPAPAETLSRRKCKPHPKFSNVGELTSLRQLGCDVDEAPFDDRSAFPFEGGETEALARLHQYVWGENGRARGPIATYKKTRNQSVGTAFSTKFSPFLAIGTISPRRIYAEIKEFEERVVANESTYWVVFELMWRDFFKFECLKVGDHVFKVHGVRGFAGKGKNKGMTWSHDEAMFQKWCDGETGYPIVDAAMTELKLTGFMSNRWRQNVASFLVFDLGIDWRWGAEWFEHWLIDHDPASNYGNWCAIAGLGFGKASYFNIHKQAKNYDRDGLFVKTWLPQLKGCSKQFVHNPSAMNASQQRVNGCVLGRGYPKACKPLKGSLGGGGRNYSSGRGNKSGGRGRNRSGQRHYSRRF